ncbi:MAG: 50S ribosomal protein L24 [Chloroflexi bacterium]|nr:50S ribosomal protein L24 [Chloroflexota bacterium]
MKIRKGDQVKVTRGDENDKGKTGEVIRVLPKEERVVVQGVNLVKKHQKQTQSGSKTIPSGIREFEAPIHISNVELVEKCAEKASGKAAKTSKSTKTVAKKAPAKAAKAAKTETKPAAKKRATGKPAADKSGDGN